MPGQICGAAVARGGVLTFTDQVHMERIELKNDVANKVRAWSDWTSQFAVLWKDGSHNRGCVSDCSCVSSVRCDYDCDRD